MWLATLTRKRSAILSYPGILILTTFGFVSSLFSWCQFAPVTVERGCLPNLVVDGTIENSSSSNWIPRCLSRNIQFIGLSLICVVSDIVKTRKRVFNLAR